MNVATDVRAVADRIVCLRAGVPKHRSVLVAVTGIDGCGKGHVAARIVEALDAVGLRAAAISVDGWLNLPDIRFDPANPAENFYLRAIRFDEMFRDLVLPLREKRSLRTEVNFTEETARGYRRHVYEFHDLDVIVLEGIYLLRREIQARYDLSVWVECSFETALERATARAQEGLPPDETVRVYETIYFPAQRIHLERDDPTNAATIILRNDPRVGDSLPAGSEEGGRDG